MNRRPPECRPAQPRILVSLLAVFLAACAISVSGQTPSNGDKGPSSKDDAGTLRVNVRLVNVFTTVTDANGAPVADLTKDDFKILEDGIPQTISIFDRESELPLSIVLAIDTSESTRRDLKLEIASAKKFVHSIVRPQDRLSIF